MVDVYTLPLDFVLDNWRPGSAHETLVQKWTWKDEFEWIFKEDDYDKYGLLVSISRFGLKEPILLGDDWRVWDGHHRIYVCARLLNRSKITVVMGKTSYLNQAPSEGEF